MLVQIVSIVFPVFTVIAIGYLYGRRHRPDMIATNQVNMGIFVPALIKPAPAGLVTLLWALKNDGKDKPGFGDVVNILHGFEGELDEHFKRSSLNGWRFDGLPWEQM